MIIIKYECDVKGCSGNLTITLASSYVSEFAFPGKVLNLLTANKWMKVLGKQEDSLRIMCGDCASEYLDLGENNENND